MSTSTHSTHRSFWFLSAAFGCWLLLGCPQNTTFFPDGGAGGGDSTLGGGAGGGGGGGGGGDGGGAGETGGGAATGGGEAGTDGGTDAGTGGGLGRSCRTVTFTETELLTATFSPSRVTNPLSLHDAFYSRPAISGSIQRSDFIDFQFWYKDPPTLPFTTSLVGATWLKCAACVLYSEDCLSTGQNCAHDYLAMSGSFSVSISDDTVDGGRYAGSVANLLLEEWDTGKDVSKDAGCISIVSLSWDAGW